MASIPEEIGSTTRQIAASLPPQFLGLLVINAVFILGLLWFMHDVAIQRIEAITKIFDACTTALIKDTQTAHKTNTNAPMSLWIPINDEKPQ